MTDQKTEQPSSDTEVSAPVQLQSFVLPNRATCFVGDVENVVEEAIKAGYQFFYVLGVSRESNLVPEWPNSPKMKTEYGPYKPRLFKVVSNLVTEAVIEIDNLGATNTFGLEQLSEAAWFRLPKIPYQLIDKLDAFFRKVEDKYGTESVVCLTYDIRYKVSESPSDGWGVVVPKQTNTAGHCKYEPATATDQIPDDDVEFVRLVGTAHSHPSMGAFASGTDHDDQDHNDGIHITFGWPRNGPTAFHIEMQVAGQTYKMSEALAFTPRPFVIPDDQAEELESWTAQVSKEEPPKKAMTPTHGTGGGRLPMHHTPGVLGGGDFSRSPWNDQDQYDDLNRYFSLTVRKRDYTSRGWPIPTQAVIITNHLDEDERYCPVCEALMVPEDKASRKCYDCKAFILADPDETIEALSEIRKARGLTMRELEEPGNYPIIHVRRSLVNQQVVLVTNVLREGNPDKVKKI